MPPSTQRVQIAVLILACAGGIACHRQTVHAAAPPEEKPPAESPQPAPAKHAGSEAGATPTPANPAPGKPSSESASPPTPAPKPVEPKPHPVAPPAPPPVETPAPKPAPPQITLRMSPAEEAEQKSQTQKSIAQAEANLRRASGRQLSDTQHDMVEKIQSFLIQSREASEIPDWSRARILAEKARLLSTELVNSL